MVRRNLPNILTFLRVPLCLCGISFELLDIPTIGLICLLFSFLTDLDGRLARKFKTESEWGKKWDPIVDALSIGLIYIYLIIFGGLPVAIEILFLAIIFRNIFLSQGFKYLHRIAQRSGESFILEKIKGINNVNRVGKCSTALQMIAIIVYFFFRINFQEIQIPALSPIIITAFVFSLISSYFYTRDGLKIAIVLWKRDLFPIQSATRILMSPFGWMVVMIKKITHAIS